MAAWMFRNRTTFLAQVNFRNDRRTIDEMLLFNARRSHNDRRLVLNRVFSTGATDPCENITIHLKIGGGEMRFHEDVNAR